MKVLILPRALALSPAERAAIEAWVSTGGTLIADSLTGIYDDRLRRQSIDAGGGWWDEFLGVKRVDYSFVEMNGVAGSAFNGTAAVAAAPPKVRKTPSWPRRWPTSAFSSCNPAGMHGPTAIFWANLTPFSPKFAKLLEGLTSHGLRAVELGLGHFVASYHRSSASYQIQ